MIKFDNRNFIKSPHLFTVVAQLPPYDRTLFKAHHLYFLRCPHNKVRIPLDIPCAPNQAFEFLTGCVACEQPDKDPSCRPTGYNTRIKCEGATVSSLVSCNPAEFGDRALERRHFFIFECLMAVIGFVAYMLVRRQQRLLDRQLMARINKQISS
ncbi:hypothetical protein SprV_0902756700 [Sparganum proliferum]